MAIEIDKSPPKTKGSCSILPLLLLFISLLQKHIMEYFYYIFSEPIPQSPHYSLRSRHLKLLVPHTH